jgi:hypothetical protein
MMAVAYVGGDAVGTLGADAVVADGPSRAVALAASTEEVLGMDTLEGTKESASAIRPAVVFSGGTKVPAVDGGGDVGY